MALGLNPSSASHRLWASYFTCESPRGLVCPSGTMTAPGTGENPVHGARRFWRDLQTRTRAGPSWRNCPRPWSPDLGSSAGRQGKDYHFLSRGSADPRRQEPRGWLGVHRPRRQGPSHPHPAESTRVCALAHAHTHASRPSPCAPTGAPRGATALSLVHLPRQKPRAGAHTLQPPPVASLPSRRGSLQAAKCVCT